VWLDREIGKGFGCEAKRRATARQAGRGFYEQLVGRREAVNANVSNPSRRRKAGGGSAAQAVTRV